MALELSTLEEAMAEAKGNGRSIEELIARHGQSAKECEEECGPDVPSVSIHQLPRRGRPRRPRADEAVPPVKTKSVKMPPAFRDELQSSSRAKGMTVHAAMRSASLEWVERNHANPCIAPNRKTRAALKPKQRGSCCFYND